MKILTMKFEGFLEMSTLILQPTLFSFHVLVPIELEV